MSKKPTQPLTDSEWRKVEALREQSFRAQMTHTDENMALLLRAAAEDRDRYARIGARVREEYKKQMKGV